MRDYMTLGSAPIEEDCAQVGADDYRTKSREECARYVELLKAKFPNIPSGVEIRTKSFPHDFGTYREACVVYDDNSQEGLAFALHVEKNMPIRWEDTDVIPFDLQEYLEEAE